MLWGRELSVKVKMVSVMGICSVFPAITPVLWSRNTSCTGAIRRIGPHCPPVEETCSLGSARLLPSVSRLVVSFALSICTPRRHELFLSLPFFCGWWSDITLRKKLKVAEYKHCHSSLAEAERQRVEWAPRGLEEGDRNHDAKVLGATCVLEGSGSLSLYTLKAPGRTHFLWSHP